MTGMSTNQWNVGLVGYGEVGRILGEDLRKQDVRVTAYDLKLDNGQAFASTAGAQLFVAGETSPGTFGIVQTVKTGEGARTMGLDPATHRIYLPAAEYETGANGRRAQKPGTFMILVVAPQTAK